MTFTSQIESLLFISIKPLSVKFLMEKTGAKKDEVENALTSLSEKYPATESGVSLVRIDDKVQLTTAGENASLISEFLKEETTGDLTPASLETLTVIAYRGPISKTELEMLRGVNCSLILRNLLMRGFIEERKDEQGLLSVYQVTFDFLKYLGITSASQLPEFETLHDHALIQQLINPKSVADATASVVADTSELNEQMSELANEQAEEETEEEEEEYEDDEDDEDDDEEEDSDDVIN